MRTPLSPLTAGSRGPSLLVPTKIIPLATTGLPYACEPSCATHLTFFFVFTSQLVGSPFMFETMLRSGVPPHFGQSPEPGSELANVNEPASMSPLITKRCFFIGVSQVVLLLCLLLSMLAGPHPRSLSLGVFAPRSGRRRFILIDLYIVVIDFRAAARR